MKKYITTKNNKACNSKIPSSPSIKTIQFPQIKSSTQNSKYKLNLKTNLNKTSS